MGSAPFIARVEPGRGATTIALSGELDMSTVPILEEHLVQAEADGVAAIVIDMVELTFMESLGVHAFVAARKRADASGRQLLLVGAKPTVRRVFELTGTDSLLTSENIAALYA
jgi:anti-sigma B factor antagonist